MKEHMNYTFMKMQERHNKSLRGAEIIYRNFISKITPKWIYRYIINISDECVTNNTGGWDETFLKKNIIFWLDENTKGNYFIVLFDRLDDDGYIIHEMRDRIYFFNKKEAAAFKMYFK